MLSIALRTSKDVIAREHGSVFCEIALAPLGVAVQRRRSPVALVLCLDRSGSMAEYGTSGPGDDIAQASKMHYARLAAEQAVGQLLDGDRIGLVSFSADARVDIPLTAVSPSTRAQIVAKICTLQPEASTNLAGGLIAARSLFGETAEMAMPCKIIALSDGLANVGVATPSSLAGLARECAAGRVTISTIGVGVDYSAETMSAIAQAAGGEFYHVGDAAAIETAVAAEVADIQMVAARDANLKITVPPLVALGHNVNLLPQEDVPGGVLIRLGDVVRPRQLIIEIATPVAYTAEHLSISADCWFVDPESAQPQSVSAKVVLAAVSPVVYADAQADAHVLGTARELIEARAVRLATASYERGEVDRAGALLSEAVATFADRNQGWDDVQGCMAELRSLQSKVSCRRLSASETKMYHARAFARATSRKTQQRTPDEDKAG